MKPISEISLFNNLIKGNERQLNKRLDVYMKKSKKQYYVTAENTWGISENLYSALLNANALPNSLLVECLSSIEHTDEESDLEDLYKWFRDLEEDPACCSSDHTTEVVVSITDSTKWKLSEVDPINGAPFYKWIGEGEMDKLNSLTMYLTIHPNGLITERNPAKP